jgi:hypothetical protein
MTDDEIVDRIFEIRVGNNAPWKQLMKLALRIAPGEARIILREIYTNDSEVCEWMDELTSRDSL